MAIYHYAVLLCSICNNILDKYIAINSSKYCDLIDSIVDNDIDAFVAAMGGDDWLKSVGDIDDARKLFYNIKDSYNQYYVDGFLGDLMNIHSPQARMDFRYGVDGIVASAFGHSGGAPQQRLAFRISDLIKWGIVTPN